MDLIAKLVELLFRMPTPKPLPPLPNLGAAARLTGLQGWFEGAVWSAYVASCEFFFWAGVMRGFLAGFALSFGLMVLINKRRERDSPSWPPIAS